jgi:hypothetical protein
MFPSAVMVIMKDVNEENTVRVNATKANALNTTTN